MIEEKVISVHYKKINGTCAYEGNEGGCNGPVTLFSISLTNHGDVHVRTMCDYHTEREKRHFTEVDGLIYAGKTAVAGMFSDAVLIDEEVAAETAAEAVKMAEKMIHGEGQ